MNKNKKIISLVAAIAMIFTMLSSFTFVNAAGEGFTLSTPVVSKDGKTATFDVGYTGLANGLASGKFTIELPSGVTAVEATPATGVTGTPNATGLPTFVYSFTLGTTPNTKAADKIVTLKLTFADAISEDTTVSVANNSNLYDTADTKFVVAEDAANPLSAGSATFHNPNAPTPKPTTTTTPAPVATEPPIDPDKPVIGPTVKPDLGFTLSDPNVSADGKSISVDVGYTGLTNGLASGKFSIVLPSEVTAVEAVPATGVTGTPNATGLPTFVYSFTLGTTPNTNVADKIVTLKLTLSTPLKYDNQIAIADNSNIYDTSDKKFVVGGTGDNAIAATNVILPAFKSGEEEKEVKTTISFSKAITVDVNDTVGEDGKSNYFIVPTIKKGAVDAKYGDDFVAMIGDVKLTSAQYSNLINGHFDADNVKDIVAENKIEDMNDLIDVMKWGLYDKSVTVSAKVVNKATGEIANPEDGVVSDEPVTFNAPKIDGVSNKTVKIGDKVTIKPTIKNATADGVLTVDVSEDAEEYVMNLKVDDETGEVSFKAAFEGSVILAYTYAFHNPKEDKDEKVTARATITIKEKTTTDNNGGGGGNNYYGNGTAVNGTIAGPSGAWGQVEVVGGASFEDIADVDWAQEAIYGLATKGIVSGRDEKTFDPHANITRAEYCKILVGAIGKDNESADASFNDVPTDAWFYHAVAVASKYGIVSGYGDGNFGPYDLITRQDMALMTQKAAAAINKALPVGSDTNFTDADQISDYAQDAVYTLASAGIISGMGDGTFAPKNNATRAQAAVIIYTTFVK